MERSRPKRVTGDDAVRIAALFTLMVLVIVTRAARDWRWGDFTDFEVMRAVGKVVLSGRGADVYQHVRAFFHPPFFALLCAPLGRLSPRAAYDAIVVVELALWCGAVAVWSRLLDASRGRLATVWLVASCAPSLWVSLEFGQPAALFLLSIGAAMVLLRSRREWAAGFALAWLFVKPPYAAIALVSMVPLRAWRTIGAALVGGATLFAIGLAAFGLRTTVAWIEATRRLGQMMSRADWSHQYQQWSLASALRTTGAPPAAALAMYLVAAIGLVAVALRALATLRRAQAVPDVREASFARAASLVALLVAVVTPYLFSYDDVLLAGPGAVFACSREARPRSSRVAIGTCIALAFVVGFGARWIRPYAPMGFVTAVWLVLESRDARVFTARRSP